MAAQICFLVAPLTVFDSLYHEDVGKGKRVKGVNLLDVIAPDYGALRHAYVAMDVDPTVPSGARPRNTEQVLGKHVPLCVWTQHQ